MNTRLAVPFALLAFHAGCSGGKEQPPSGRTTTAPEPATTAAPATSAAPSASASAAPTASGADAQRWFFDHDKTDELPAGFEAFPGGGKTGKWFVTGVQSSPSAPQVLAHLAAKGDAHATLVVTGPALADAGVSVRCRTADSAPEQLCGVVLRCQDDKSYYLAHVDARTGEVSLHVAKDGKLRALGGWKGATIGAAWHELRLDAKGDHLQVQWDGASVYEAHDQTLAGAGRAGVWTKADSVTYFDDLAITPL